MLMARFDILLEKKLTKLELKELKTSLDILGEIAIIEIPKKLSKKSSIIGRAVLKANPQLRAVFKKASAVRGEYRVRALKKIAGRGSTEIIYRENGCFFKFDASKVFYTPRMSSERMRVAQQVKKGEVVLDMFAGIGPFSILIAKIQPSVKIIHSIDSNPDAISSLIASAGMNKVSHKIIAYAGDARTVVHSYLAHSANRVIMNLPMTNEDFFGSALLALNKKGILHFYTFAKTDAEVRKKIQKAIKKSSEFKILSMRKVRQYAPRIWNFAVDIEIMKIKRMHKINK